MKKIIFNSTLILSFLSLLTACQSRQDHRNYLTPQQTQLLYTPAAGSTVVFDENGIRTSTIVSAADINTTLTKEMKGSIFGGGDNYVKQYGQVYYNDGLQSKINIYVSSSDPAVTTSESYQWITIDNASTYTIEFKNKLPSKTINGITYSDVILGINSYSNDTLYWKKGTGILGWKRADQSFTAYRVF